MNENKLFSNLEDVTSFIDKYQALQLKVPLYAPFRFYPGDALAEQKYVLFDRNEANANNWGSDTKSAASLGNVVDDIDMPRWFIQPNRTMPPKRAFLAEYMGFDWQPIQIQSASPYYVVSETFMQDKLRIRSNPIYMEFRPDQKDVDMQIPINHINDLNKTVVREVSSEVAPLNIAYYNHMLNSRDDQHAGLYPFFSEELNVPGMFYDENSIIDISFRNEREMPAGEIISQVYLRIVFLGWYFRPL